MALLIPRNTKRLYAVDVTGPGGDWRSAKYLHGLYGDYGVARWAAAYWSTDGYWQRGGYDREVTILRTDVSEWKPIEWKLIEKR